jgi:hypothetical protein
VCEAVLASVAVNERSQTATKIFSEDRPPARRLSIAKIALLRSAMIAARARAAEFPDRERRLIRRCVSQREDDFFRTKLLMRVFTPVFNGESAIGTICARRGRRVERHAQRFLIPQDPIRRRTDEALVFRED